MAVVIIVFAMFLVIILNVLRINITKGQEYTEQAKSQIETSKTTINAKRGDILDTNGVTLATSTQVYNLILDPKLILTDEEKYREPTVNAIVTCFGFTAEELNTLINDNPETHYIVLTEDLTYAETVELTKMQEEDSNIVGVFLESNYKRNYTYNTLACSVLGFTDEEGGRYGLEYEYDDELTGTDGSRYTYVNSENIIETVINEAEGGNSIQTTLDYNIQTIVERKIEEYFEAGNIASTVAVIVQDPDTGAILAMADSNNFDPNDPTDLTATHTEEELAAMSEEDKTNAMSSSWSNFCVTSSYEPGSTFKPFTVAAALEEGTANTETDVYNCTGSMTYLGSTVGCHMRSGHGELTLANAVALSCNVALMQIAENLGSEKFTRYQSDFGFGKLTNIDLPYEMSCSNLMYTAENMTVLDLATNSFGQNFNVTMIQMSTAFCSLINGGYYYQPYVVEEIYNSEGESISAHESTLVSRPISQDTSDDIKEFLRLAVAEGTGGSANVEGYVISGKTGTAQKGDKSTNIYLVSFIGFAPYENPEVVCYVVIDEPEEGEESPLAAALFSEIMSEVLPYLNAATAEEDTDPMAKE